MHQSRALSTALSTPILFAESIAEQHGGQMTRSSQAVRVFASAMMLLGFLERPTGAVELELGSPNKPLNGDTRIWVSTCPAQMRPISGYCGVIDAGGGSAALRSFGIDVSTNGWQCTWNAQVQGSVQAWCAKLP
jgi:hypothetical protein